MNNRKKAIISGYRCGLLTAKWSWNAKSDRIWKCTCKCGNSCYVKELALREKIVMDCGCNTYQQYSLELENLI